MKNEQFTQILRAINDVREDVKEFKNDMNKRWDENDKRWEENHKLWAQNEERWNGNNKQILSIKNELARIEDKVDRNYNGIFKVFDRYEAAAENMYQENRQRIIELQKRLKMEVV